MTTVADASRSVAIAGLGAVGRELARRIVHDLPAYRLTAASAKNHARASTYLARIGSAATIVPLRDLADHADIVIEAAPAGLLPEIAEPVVTTGKDLITLSVGALLDSWSLVEKAEQSGARIHVPTGALAGLDAVQAVSQGPTTSIRMITRKPVAGLAGAPYLTTRGIDLTDIDEPRRIFEGSVREAITGFPANLNVAVALSLAGAGPDQTVIEVWADPTVEHNTHRVVVESDAASLDLHIRNVPSDNPATGRSTALSVIALLRKMSCSLRIGT